MEPINIATGGPSSTPQSNLVNSNNILNNNKGGAGNAKHNAAGSMQPPPLSNGAGGGHPYGQQHHRGGGYRAYSDNSQINAPYLLNNNSNNHSSNHHYHNNTNNAQRMELPLRVLVPTSTMGAIIGKGGVAIKQIIADTLTRVDVHRNHGPVPQEKIISIYGSAANCSRALQKIMEIVRNELHSNEKPEPEVPLRLLAHNAHVGRVIGKNGATINSIMKSTETRIAVSSSSWDYSQFLTERVITIQGQLVDQVRAEQQISSILRQFYAKDLMGAMCANNYAAVNAGVPNVVGPQVGNGATSAIALSRGPGDFAAAGSVPTGPHHYAVGAPDHVGQRMGANGNNPMYAPMPMAMPFIDPMHSTAAAYMQQGYGPMSPLASAHNIAAAQLLGPQVAHALGGLSMSAMRIASLDKKKELATVYVPAHAVGPIIGTGGSTIREMIHASGASIKVTSPAHYNRDNVAVNQTNSENVNDSALAPEIGDLDETSETTTQLQSEHEATNHDGTNSRQRFSPVNETLSETSHAEHHLSDAMKQHCILGAEEMRKVTVFGTPEAQWRAQYMIFRKAAGNQTEGVFKVEIQIPTAQAGRIIGRNGSTVKELQLFTNARIKIGDNDQPVGEETPVYITGEFLSVQAAQRQIRALVAKSLQDTRSKQLPQTVNVNNLLVSPDVDTDKEISLVGHANVNDSVLDESVEPEHDKSSE